MTYGAAARYFYEEAGSVTVAERLNIVLKIEQWLMYTVIVYHDIEQNSFLCNGAVKNPEVNALLNGKLDSTTAFPIW